MIDYRGKVLQCARLINAKQSQALQNGLSASCHNYTQRTQTDDESAGRRESLQVCRRRRPCSCCHNKIIDANQYRHTELFAMAFKFARANYLFKSALSNGPIVSLSLEHTAK